MSYVGACEACDRRQATGDGRRARCHRAGRVRAPEIAPTARHRHHMLFQINISAQANVDIFTSPWCRAVVTDIMRWGERSTRKTLPTYLPTYVPTYHVASSFCFRDWRIISLGRTGSVPAILHSTIYIRVIQHCTHSKFDYCRRLSKTM